MIERLLDAPVWRRWLIYALSTMVLAMMFTATEQSSNTNNIRMVVDLILTVVVVLTVSECLASRAKASPVPPRKEVRGERKDQAELV